MRVLEEHSWNAWPALRTLIVDGWLMRLSGGATKPVNSVNAFDPTASIASIIPFAENLYARHGQRAIFRITDLAPRDTDAALADAGYERFDPSLVLTAPAAAVVRDAAVHLQAAPSQDWLDGFARLTGLSDPARPICRWPSRTGRQDCSMSDHYQHRPTLLIPAKSDTTIAPAALPWSG